MNTSPDDKSADGNKADERRTLSLVALAALTATGSYTSTLLFRNEITRLAENPEARRDGMRVFVDPDDLPPIVRQILVEDVIIARQTFGIDE